MSEFNLGAALDHYLERARDNLGPLSVEKHDPAAILREWHATGRVEDLEETSGTCGVCDKEELRYLFEIKNERTGQKTDSGSSCILRFNEIGVMQGADVVFDSDKKYEALTKALEQLKRANQKSMRIDAVRRVRKSLEELPPARHRLDKDTGESIFLSICNTVDRALEEDGKLFPKQFSLFIWAAKEAHEVLPFSAFRGFINLQGRGVEQARELRTTQRWRYLILKSALKPEQIRNIEGA